MRLHIRRVAIDRDLADQEIRDPASFAEQIRAVLQGENVGPAGAGQRSVADDVARAVHERIASVQPNLGAGQRP